MSITKFRLLQVVFTLFLLAGITSLLSTDFRESVRICYIIVVALMVFTFTTSNINAIFRTYIFVDVMFGWVISAYSRFFTNFIDVEKDPTLIFIILFFTLMISMLLICIRNAIFSNFRVIQKERKKKLTTSEILKKYED